MTSTTSAWKILTQEQWTGWTADPPFKGAGIDVEDGFIHLSTTEQLKGTYDNFFKDQKDLVLVRVDLEKVTGEVKWESSSKSTTTFPHVYGSIPMGAVMATHGGWAGVVPDV